MALAETTRPSPDAITSALPPRFGALIRSLPGAALLLSADEFRILEASPFLLQASGAGITGRLLSDLLPGSLGAVPEEEAEALQALLRQARETGRPGSLPPRPWRMAGDAAGGRVRTLSAAPVPGEDGAVEFILLQAEDVTEREADRARLAHTLKLQRVTGRTARLGGWEMSLATGRIAWAEEACAVLDLPPGHVSGLREALSFALPEWRAGLRAALKGCVRNGTGFASEVEIVAARGWRKWVRIVGEAERDGAGRVCGVAGAIQNVSERKAVQEANQRLAERLAARVGGITDAFLTLDNAFRLTYANPMALALLAITDAERLGQPVWESPGFAAEGPIGRRLAAAAAEQRTVRFEAFLDAAGRWFDIHAFPAVGGLTVTLHDVTERRREQEKLRLLEACVARMNDIVVVTEAAPIDKAGPRIVFVNDAFERRTGLAREQVYGQTPRILQGPGTQRAELDRIRASLAASRPVRAELINYTRTGEEFWTELDIQPVGDAEGRITHWVAVNREITERRHYQTQLEEQAALLDQVGDSILVRTMDGRISYTNTSAQRLYGFSAEEMLGEDPRALIHERHEALGDAMAELLASGHWAGQLFQRCKDGTGIVVESRWTLMRHADGSPRAILSVNTDISGRLELEARLRQSQRLEAVGQLTGGVAHDFNNLLTVILGNAEILAESLVGDDELRDMAEMTMAAAERGAALTNRLLAFSRRQALDPKVTEVNRLLTGLGTMLRRTIGEHIDLRLLRAGDLWHAMIDPPQLENAVLNLCLNARDAMPSGGRLTIETRNIDHDTGFAVPEGELAPGEYVMIAVSDTGTGMEPEVLARAFEPFFTTKEVGQGSGLGLSMVYGFMKQSGGHASISSTPGLGTVVRLYLPRAHGRSAPEPAAPAVRGAGGSERVLLVEDDVLVREHVAAQLRELGYRAEVVPGAAEALEALAAQDFDLLFTDVVMPGGMDGLDLAAEARRLRPSMRVLLTSGYTEGALTSCRPPEPDVMMLSKPYKRRDMAEAVRRALDQGR
ncbi:PAS domain S-box protein [Roseomonas sp. GCM10028921]